MKFGSSLKVALVVSLLGCIVASASAKPAFWDTFKSKYDVPEGSKLMSAGCNVCHSGPPRKNKYGETVAAHLKAQARGKMSAEDLDAVGATDSDGDGFSNADEIKADTLPGDPQSKPPGAPPSSAGGPGAGTAVATESSDSSSSPLAPPHSFHPLVVHFPIGLFLFGAFLEVVGKMKQRDELRKLAVWNLGFGAIAGILAAITGLIAYFRTEQPWSGDPLLHLIIAGAAAVLMVPVALWRRKSTPDTAVYWTLLMLVCALITVGGHLGAVLVYG